MLSDEVTKDISRETRLLAIPNSSANLSRGVNSGNCLSRNESIVVHPPPPLPPPPAPPSQQQLHHSSPAMTPSIISASAAIQTAPNNLGCGARTRECAGCTKPITERFLLKALDLFWHEDCLKCGCCDCRLGEVGSTLYTKANLILCKRDYLRLFGTTGYCAACNKVIPAFEMVMRAKSNVYHLECFACQQCNHRFCVGDRFYLCDNKILCEYDYEERLVFANMAYNPSSLAHIRRQVSNLQSPADSMITPIPSTSTVAVRGSSVPLPSSGASSSSVLKSANHPHFAYKNHQQQQGAPPNCNAVHHRDDGSSGYGSPDSEIAESSQAL